MTVRLTLTFLGAALLLAVTGEGTLNNVDSDQYLAQARAVWEEGTLSIPDRLARGHVGENPRSSDGRLYMKVGLGTVVTYGPFIALAHALASVSGRSADSWCQVTCSLANTLAGALIVIYVAFALMLVGVPRGRATILGLVTVAGTYLWAMTKISHVDIQQAACLFAAFAHVLACRDRIRPGHLVAASVWGSMALLLKLQSLPLLVPLLAYALFVLGRRGELRVGSLVRLLAAPVGVLALTAAINALKWGSPLATGYPGPGEGGEIAYTLEGAAIGTFLSPDRSFPLFAPACVLLLPLLPRALRRLPAETLAAVGVFAAAYAVLLAWFRVWHAGSCYGPRYLATTVPFLWFAAAGALGTVELRAPRRAASAFLALCVLAQLPGIAVPYYEVEAARRGARDRGWEGVPAALSDRRPGQYELNVRVLLSLTGEENTYRELGFPVDGVHASRSELVDRMPFWFLRLREVLG